MGIGCKPIGKFESIMRKMSNEKEKVFLATKAKQEKKKKR